MTDEEKIELLTELAMSHDFYGAFLIGASNIAKEGEEPDLKQIALFFYYSGYVAALDFDKNKE